MAQYSSNNLANWSHCPNPFRVKLLSLFSLSWASIKFEKRLFYRWLKSPLCLWETNEFGSFFLGIKKVLNIFLILTNHLSTKKSKNWDKFWKCFKMTWRCVLGEWSGRSQFTSRLWKRAFTVPSMLSVMLKNSFCSIRFSQKLFKLFLI